MNFFDRYDFTLKIMKCSKIFLILECGKLEQMKKEKQNK